MAIDIKEIVDNVVEKITSDASLQRDFAKNPIQVIEKLIGIDLPDEKIERIVELVKAKIQIDDLLELKNKIGKIDDISDVAEIAKGLGSLGKLFGK